MVVLCEYESLGENVWKEEEMLTGSGESVCWNITIDFREFDDCDGSVDNPCGSDALCL